MHRCPDCGRACYCNGDIDDCEIADTAQENACVHCPNDERSEPEYWEPDGEPDDAARVAGPGTGEPTE